MARMEGSCFCKQKIPDPVTKYTRLDPALRDELQKIVEVINAPGRGILAMDESSSSMDSKFREFGLDNTEMARRDLRYMLLSADKSELSECISGVILNHETIYQKTPDGRDFMDFLGDRKLMVGVKVDRGTTELFGTEGENTTEGLDGLQERCISYKMAGCHFAKWRCIYKLSNTRPSQLAMKENANVLAKYATIAQSARLVPIIEPEILTTGDHDVERSLEVHEEVLSVLFRTLKQYHVFLEGVILKTAMVVPGIQDAKFCNPRIIADLTLTALRRTVPSAVPSIVFLSGGQSDEDATINLNAIAQADGRKPWILSFCYGRALRDAAMKTWKGNDENAGEAQSIFLRRAKSCSEASRGKLNVEEFEGKTRAPNDAGYDD